MEVAESSAGLLIYKELDYSCIHGGKMLVPFPTLNDQNNVKHKVKSHIIYLK
jgi:hypothetical protein